MEEPRTTLHAHGCPRRLHPPEPSGHQRLGPLQAGGLVPLGLPRQRGRFRARQRQPNRHAPILGRGRAGTPLTQAAQEALEEAFANVSAEAETGANARRFSGVTSHAARAAKTVDSVKTGKHAGADEEAES